METDQELALTLAESDSPVKESRDRIWLLTYPDKQKFYLTDKEREEFLQQVAKDKIIVQIGKVTLTNRFSHLFQYKEKTKEKKWEIVGDTAKYKE